MNPRRLSLVLLTLAPLTSFAAPQPNDSGWRLVQTTDDLTGSSDRRLILRAEHWSTAATATLILACGDRIPNAEGKSLLFFAGQPLEPFGNELAYVELRFDDQPRPIKTYLTIRDLGEGHVTREVAFLGTDQSPFFSRPLFEQLLGAGKLSVTYRAYGEIRTVEFRPGGLKEALPQLSACHWTG